MKRVFFLGYSELGESVLDFLKKRGDIELIGQGIAQNASEIFFSLASEPQNRTLDYPTFFREFRGLEFDLALIASFPKLMPRELLGLPKDGFLNIHTSYLPRNRGVHPINWALIRDEAFTGLTLHHVCEGMDKGNIINQIRIEISDHDDALSLRQRLRAATVPLLENFFQTYLRVGKISQGQIQDEGLVTLASKRTQLDGKINFHDRTRNVFNLVRALVAPYPAAFAFRSEGQSVPFSNVHRTYKPGEVIAELKPGVYAIATLDGAVLLESSSSLTVGEILK